MVAEAEFINMGDRGLLIGDNEIETILWITIQPDKKAKRKAK